MRSRRSSTSFFFFSVLFVFFLRSYGQQVYLNNTQLNCTNTVSNTLGYVCNGDKSPCDSYLLFRTQTSINSATAIGYLLGADANRIVQANNFSDAFQQLPVNTEVIVPVNCSCSGDYYQFNVSYTLVQDDTYFKVANNTYEALTTCQALMAQNPYSYTKLRAGLKIVVPVRCACPTGKQAGKGIKYLLTYPIAKGEDSGVIGLKFGVDGQSILDANEISATTTIFYFTPLLIPLEKEPSLSENFAPSPSPSSESPIPPPEDGSDSNKKWVFIGVGIGVPGLLLVSGFVFFFFCVRGGGRRSDRALRTTTAPKSSGSSAEFNDGPEKKLPPALSEDLRDAVRSLAVYKFQELQKATNDFHRDSLIKGSVYRATINGGLAAVKRMKGDVSNELKVLKQINHSNVIRLSGFCINEGNTYLVFEFAENGSLADWIHGDRLKEEEGRSRTTINGCLSWKQRMQIACDVADGLNYLHNYTNPVHIHKDLKSSNILLDDQFRAKIANFGLTRSVKNDGNGLQLTRHVIGTQGYMAPEYLENGLITTKLDVYSFGVVLLELLSGREAVLDRSSEHQKEQSLLSAAIGPILDDDDAKEKLRSFMDSGLGSDYPLDVALVVANLARKCIADDLNSRPSTTDVLMTLWASLGWNSSTPSSGVSTYGSNSS